MLGLKGSVGDLIFCAFPLETEYTEQKSGANFDTEVATSAFLNALYQEQRATMFDM